MQTSSLVCRRQFLQRFSFSAAALLAGGLPLRAITADRSAQHFFLFGDWGALIPEPQELVAKAMVDYAKAQGIKPAALFLLGDNFYGSLEGGVTSPRWQTQFEEMYPERSFPGPCYAILGNHDYNVEPAGKAQAQLDYAAAHRGTRWTMPSKWYRFDFPQEKPLVTFIALDSNYQKPTVDKLALTLEEQSAQLEWFKAELAKPRTSRYLVICGHHPLYSNGGDNPRLIAEWDSLLRQHSAHLYFSGHIHDLEHLEFEGHPTSFVVSGGGGTILRKKEAFLSMASNHFAQLVHGFTHLEISEERLVVRHLNGQGEQLHVFSKSPHGKMEVL